MKAVTEKEWQRKKRGLSDVQFSTDKKARKIARHRKTPMKSNIVRRLLDPMFCRFYKIARKQRLLVETLYVSYIS